MSNKKTFSTLVIVTIAFCAFLAGIVQTPYLEQVQSTEKEISALQYQLKKTGDLVRQVITSDRIALAQATKMTQKARETANQYYVLTVLNLTNTLTPEQSDAYLSRIGEQLWQIDMWVRSTYINTINDEFESYPDDKYYFADKETTGFDLIIEREVWENYLPIRSENIANFLSNNFFPTGTDSEILAYYYTPDYIHAANITQLNLVFLDVKRKIQEEIAILEEDYYKDKTTTERLSMGAILTTVTMILASAMSNRLQDKSTEHSFSVLRGDVLNKKELVILKRDWISIPVLLFSVILAVVGVLIPLIIPYFI